MCWDMVQAGTQSSAWRGQAYRVPKRLISTQKTDTFISADVSWQLILPVRQSFSKLKLQVNAPVYSRWFKFYRRGTNAPNIHVLLDFRCHSLWLHFRRLEPASPTFVGKCPVLTLYFASGGKHVIGGNSLI